MNKRKLVSIAFMLTGLAAVLLATTAATPGQWQVSDWGPIMVFASMFTFVGFTLATIIKGFLSVFIRKQMGTLATFSVALWIGATLAIVSTGFTWGSVRGTAVLFGNELRGGQMTFGHPHAKRPSEYALHELSCTTEIPNLLVTADGRQYEGRIVYIWKLDWDASERLKKYLAEHGDQSQEAAWNTACGAIKNSGLANFAAIALSQEISSRCSDELGESGSLIIEQSGFELERYVGDLPMDLARSETTYELHYPVQIGLPQKGPTLVANLP